MNGEGLNPLQNALKRLAIMRETMEFNSELHERLKNLNRIVTVSIYCVVK